jgi:hypothetical protein
LRNPAARAATINQLDANGTATLNLKGIPMSTPAITGILNGVVVAAPSPCVINGVVLPKSRCDQLVGAQPRTDGGRSGQLDPAAAVEAMVRASTGPGAGGTEQALVSQVTKVAEKGRDVAKGVAATGIGVVATGVGVTALVTGFAIKTAAVGIAAGTAAAATKTGLVVGLGAMAAKAGVGAAVLIGGGAVLAIGGLALAGYGLYKLFS